jgi:hypothetical protein
MSVVECAVCGAPVEAGAATCPECGSPVADPDGVETRVRRYWSAPDLWLFAGLVLAGLGAALLAFELWLWAVLALVLAAIVFVLRWSAGRRHAAAAFGATRTRLGTHRRVVGARSKGQLELFRLRRELAELKTECSRAYEDLGRATHAGDTDAASAATERVDEVGTRIRAREDEIAAHVAEMKKRVREAQRASKASNT